MTVSVAVAIPILISIISVAFAIFFGLSKYNRANRIDIKEDSSERATMNAMVMTKLESISDDIKEIRRDNKEIRQEVQQLHDKVLIMEQKVVKLEG